jgi:two-component system response regulator DctR
MEPIHNATVYIVDDDSGVRDALAWLLRSRRLLSEAFASAEAFDAHVSRGFKVQSPSCVLLDVRMGGLSGLAMFEKLIAYGLLPTMPVIFLTGHADVPTAVDTVKRGAFDFFEKPFSDNALVDRVEQALGQSAAALVQRIHQLLTE